jgi:hypothetical protein
LRLGTWKVPPTPSTPARPFQRAGSARPGFRPRFRSYRAYGTSPRNTLSSVRSVPRPLKRGGPGDAAGAHRGGMLLGPSRRSTAFTFSTMRFRPSNSAATFLGVLLMLIAFANSNVTLARGRYASVLITAMVCGLLSLVCLAIPFVRGPMGWRVAAVVFALPMLLIVSDFLRRAPSVFGGG